MMMLNRQNKLWAVCAAIGLHGAALALIVFGLSGNTTMLPDIGKMNFVWVTLSEKSGQTILPAQKNNSFHQASETRVQSAVAPEIQMVRHHRDETEQASLSPAGVEKKQSSIFPEAKNVSDSQTEVVQYGAGKIRNAMMDNQTEPASGAASAITRALPLYRENPPPGYPEIARQRGYEGVVLVEAEILTDGRVGQAEVRKSSGYAILDHAAVSAVRAWKFEPARKSGIAQKATAQLPIKFVLNDNHSHM
jgi:TonB family protein